MTPAHVHDDVFPSATHGLVACRPSHVVDLADGDTYELRIGPVTNQLGHNVVRMLAYNGSIPGPTLRARQGSHVSVRVRNDGDHETTVHWHGLRLDNLYDGVPHETQAPIPVGGEYTYLLRFPDDGVYWYHPHVREDYGLEMGLYGNIIVDPANEAWPPADREVVVTLDDILVEDGRIAPFRTTGPTHTAMGRFGNVMLTGGYTDLTIAAQAGEIIRMFLTNTANTRIFNFAVAGTRMKLVAGDNGRFEREHWVDSVLLAPSERAVIDVRFERPGTFALEHRTGEDVYELGSVHVTGSTAAAPASVPFETLHANDDLAAQRATLSDETRRPPDKTLVFTATMPQLHHDAAQNANLYACPMHPEVTSTEPGTCPKCGMRLVAADDGPASLDHHSMHHDSEDGLEWEDLMPEMNAETNASNMIWALVDETTGAQNMDIDWTFHVGDRVKLRLVNTMDSDHPMHHPFHVHGAGRFLVLTRGGEPTDNLVWKDTVLVRAGETVDILLEVTEPGLWMAHCHIAEHNQVGMMFTFRVNPA